MPRILIGNIKGPKGDVGPRGPQGIQGIQGPQGPMPPLTNNFLATTPGQSALDAVAGKTLKDDVTKLYSDLDDRGAVADLVAIANTGLNSRRVVQCNENTLNTPYKAGLTNGKSGTAYINMSSADYGTILYITSGTNRIFLRSKDSGTWNEWDEVLKKVDCNIKTYEITVAANTLTQITSMANAGRNWIPVVVGHGSAIKSSAHVTYDGGKWYIIADVAQLYRIDFYKYPVSL